MTSSRLSATARLSAWRKLGRAVIEISVTRCAGCSATIKASLVPRFRNSQTLVAAYDANFGIKGTSGNDDIELQQPPAAPWALAGSKRKFTCLASHVIEEVGSS